MISCVGFIILLKFDRGGLDPFLRPEVALNGFSDDCFAPPRLAGILKIESCLLFFRFPAALPGIP